MRRPFDAYFTPASAVHSLLKVIGTPSGRVLECCSGEGAIARPLHELGCEVITNDINLDMPSVTHGDATKGVWWHMRPSINWVVSNPPFSVASKIVPLAYQAATVGVAMLLRLSFLEPCEDRAEFLSQHPPTTLIVLPRISFTNDGRHDSVTCAWMVWEKQSAQQRIVIERKATKAKAAA